MKKFKKTVSILLILTVILTLIPEASIFANSYQTKQQNTISSTMNSINPVPIPTPTPQPQNPQISAEKESKQPSYLIKFKNENAMKKGKDKIKKAGKKIKKDFPRLNTICTELSTQMYDSLRNDEEIERIEPDYEVITNSENTPWGVEQIKAVDAHQSGIVGKGIKVAVFDTGISEHPDLSVVGGVSFVEGVQAFSDENGHGTHVAGTISALLNSEGVIGVSPCSSLYAVKVISGDGKGNYSSIIAGIDWAIENKINIINMSFGSSEYSQILEEAINLAYQNNILIIAAAGNEGRTFNPDCILYPAAYDNVISVGALDRLNARATFSSIGPELDLMAPGVDIYSTLNNGLYGNMSGTSMASPHVAGAAALVWSKYPGLTNDDVRDLLEQNADNLGDANYYGNGITNVSNILKVKSSENANDHNKKNVRKAQNNKKSKKVPKDDKMQNNPSTTPLPTAAPTPTPEVNDENRKQTIDYTTASVPSISTSNLSSTSVVWNVVYPTSGIWGNRLEIWNSSNGVWGDVSGTFYTTDGSYTSTGLTPGATYMGRLTWYDGSWHSIDIHITTPITSYNTPSISASNITNNSIYWNVVYPASGVWGDRLEIWNCSTGEWRDVSGTYSTTNGTYCASNLTPGTTYMGRLTWYDGSWHSIDTYATTTNNPVQPPQPPTDDYGNNISSAYNIPLDSQISCSINYAGDEDYFRFVAPRTGQYKIAASGSIDNYGYLLDANGNQLSANDDSNGTLNFTIEYTLTAGQTYYVRVRHYFNVNTGAYGIIVTQPPVAVLSDLIVTDIFANSNELFEGMNITFTARITNQGAGATSSGINHRIGFKIDNGATILWYNNSNISIAPGASVDVTVNGSVDGSNTWEALIGSHTINAYVDDLGLISESNENNNEYCKVINILSSELPGLSEINYGDELEDLLTQFEITRNGNTFTIQSYDTEGNTFTNAINYVDIKVVDGKEYVDYSKFIEALIPEFIYKDRIAVLDAIDYNNGYLIASVDGEIDRATYQSKYIENNANIQAALIAAGCWIDTNGTKLDPVSSLNKTHKVDGIYGKITRASIIKFQKEIMKLPYSKIFKSHVPSDSTPLTSLIADNQARYHIGVDSITAERLSAYIDYSVTGVTNKLQELTNLSNQYVKNITGYYGDSKIINELVLSYIRREKYNDSDWKQVAGTINNQLVSYINTQSPSLFTYFHKYVLLNDPISSNKIDFVHYCAVVAGCVYKTTLNDAGWEGLLWESRIDDVCGWAGDLQSLLESTIIKTHGSTDYNTLYSYASKVLGVASPVDDVYKSPFSMWDVIADIDAYNISDEVRTTLFVNLFNSYYTNTNNLKTRYSQFIGDTTKTMLSSFVSEYTQQYYKGIDKAPWPLLSKVNVQKIQGTAVRDAFVNFLWNLKLQEN